MNSLKIIFFAAILGLAFVCNSCSMIYYLYFRNFSDKTLTIRVINPIGEENYRKFYINKSILKMNRYVGGHDFDSSFVTAKNDELILSIPPKSTIYLRHQNNNPVFMLNRWDGPNTIVTLECNNQVIDTLTNSRDNNTFKKWKMTGGLLIKDVIYYDYHEKAQIIK